MTGTKHSTRRSTDDRRRHAAPVAVPTSNDSTDGDSRDVPSATELTCHICCRDGTEVTIPRGKVTSRCASSRTICKSCLQHHIHEIVLKGQYDEIRCICSRDGCNLLLQPYEVKAHSDKTTFAAYDVGLLRLVLARDPEFCWCSRAGCGSGQLHAGRHRYPIMRCHMCEQRTCFTHRCEWHSGTTCAEYDEAATRSEEAALVQLLQRGHIKRCPKCNSGIEKDGGCDRMTCQTKSGGCGEKFCWRCLAPYNGATGIYQVGNKAHKKSCQHYM